MKLLRIFALAMISSTFGLQTEMFYNIGAFRYQELEKATLPKTKIQCCLYCLEVEDCEGIQYDLGQCSLVTGIMFMYTSGASSDMGKVWVTEETYQKYLRKENGKRSL